MSFLEVPKNMCNQCHAPITTMNFVWCHNCEKKFHFNPCTVLSESTYNSMSGTRKVEWKCHQCKPRTKSPNSIYQAFVFNENNAQQNQPTQQQLDIDAHANKQQNNNAPSNQTKQQREADDVATSSKRFKEAANNNNNTMNASLSSTQSDISEIKSGMVDIKSAMQQIASSVVHLNTSNVEIRDQLKDAMTKINETLSSLTDQVKDLQVRDREKTQQINEMDKRIQKLEQQSINKNIEINNMPVNDVEPLTVIKRVSASVGIQLCDADFSRVYRTKKSEKIIVEFSSLQKKRELMQKMKGHRIDINVISGETDKPTNNFIYVNDELTPNNRRLLWMSKTKAKECNWKYVWVRDGHIFARKSEGSSHIVINNASDIELITVSN